MYLHDEDTVGTSCPNTSILGKGDGAHFLMDFFGIALHDVLVVQGDVASVLILVKHVDASAIGGYPDVALAVFNSLIGSIGTERVGVFVVVMEIQDGISSIAGGRYFVDAVVFVAYPIVAGFIHRDAVRSADGIAVRVVGNDALGVHLFIIDENLASLVGQQHRLALLVGEHASDLVVERRFCSWHQLRPFNSVLLYFQFLQTSANGR